MEKFKPDENLATSEAKKSKKPEDKEFNPERVDRLLAVREKNAEIMAEIETIIYSEIPSKSDNSDYQKLYDEAKEKSWDLDIKYRVLPSKSNFYCHCEERNEVRRRSNPA